VTLPIYTLNFKTHGGRIFSRRELKCESDQHAMQIAMQHLVPAIGNGFDLCQGTRLVQRYPVHRAGGDAQRLVVPVD
jgi:hypothetical protein